MNNPGEDLFGNIRTVQERSTVHTHHFVRHACLAPRPDCVARRPVQVNRIRDLLRERAEKNAEPRSGLRDGTCDSGVKYLARGDAFPIDESGTRGILGVRKE